MEQLNCLWDIENHHNSLITYKKELNSLEKEIMTNKTEKKLEKTENTLMGLKSSQLIIKEKLRETEKKLKAYNFNIAEVEKSLYNGHTKDIRQLEYLSVEKEKLKNIINDTETELLEFMEEMELAEKEFAKMEILVNEIKVKNVELKEYYQEIKEELNTKIDFEEKKIEALESEVDKTLLNRYSKIRKSRGSGIALVNNNACSGCNMVIPTILIDGLNKGNEIIYCESCGRILCKL